MRDGQRRDLGGAQVARSSPQQTIARSSGLPLDAVTVHVVQGGGSFGRRLFFDAALEAARISKAAGGR